MYSSPTRALLLVRSGLPKPAFIHNDT